MTPVLQSEQRLDRLKKLRAQVDREIRELEAGQARAAKRTANGVPKTRRKKAEDRVAAHLARLGVTAYTVKEWAFDAGLIPAITRGRISAYLVDEYEKAHQ